MVALMLGWIEQKHVCVPGSVNVSSNWSPGRRVADPHRPSSAGTNVGAIAEDPPAADMIESENPPDQPGVGEAMAVVIVGDTRYEFVRNETEGYFNVCSNLLGGVRVFLYDVLYDIEVRPIVIEMWIPPED
ncbi:hypothetical protein MNBD_ACTINO02-68 [hydrothermal vent metagenome]|uniref:Uncharacterized protein n=1 Tax=hydrothermal vent metagenome TaxID=652676 RepID=A0A3B0SGI2_9ZZZZ